MTRAGAAERKRLNETFAALCRIDSPSGREAPVAEWIERELMDLGLTVEHDRGYAGSNAPNLLVRLPGSGDGESGAPGGSILLCAHMDTVPAVAPIEPVIHDGAWQNAHAAILGADNKAAVAILLELARRTVTVGPVSSAGLELLFTVSEEDGLNGAKTFEARRLRSAFGYVMDLANPIGEIVTSSPTYHAIDAVIAGRAAHAGLRPETGRNAIMAAARGIAAMPNGRLDAETTVNAGTIRGGTARNVVADRCELAAEVRSLDDTRAEAVVTEVIDHLQDAVNAAECDLDVTVQRMFAGYRVRGGAAEVRLAEQALERCGYTPRHVPSGGGSDANALREQGFACLNLANGTERNHQPDERVSVAALEGMLDVVFAIVHSAPEFLTEAQDA